MKNRVFSSTISPLLIGAALLLGACVNLKPKHDSTKLYILGSIEPVVSSDFGAAAIYISRPYLPAYVAIQRLQYRKQNGELNTLSHARWGEPLEEGVARALAEQLISTASKSVSAFYPWPNRLKDSMDLQVRFYQLGALENGEVRVSAVWELKEGSIVHETGSFQSVGVEWTPGDAESYVAGINTALKQFAQELADSL